MVGVVRPGLPAGFVSPPLRVLLTGGRGQLGRDLRDVLAGSTPDGGGTPASAARRRILPALAKGAYEVVSPGTDVLNVVDRTAVA